MFYLHFLSIDLSWMVLTCCNFLEIYVLWFGFFKGRFWWRRKSLLIRISEYGLLHHKVHPIVFNLIYNMVYFDKYKYEKIDVVKVAFFIFNHRENLFLGITYVRQYVCLFVCLFVCFLFVCLFVCLSRRLQLNRLT